MQRFPHFTQPDSMDCGPTCLRMVAKYYGRSFTMPFLREKVAVGKEGVSLLGIAQAAEQMGMRTVSVRIPFARLAAEAPLPCIVHWGQNHFVVVYAIKTRKFPVRSATKVYVADPASGLLTFSGEEFESQWASTKINDQRVGVVLLLEPTPNFYESPEISSKRVGFGRLFRYLWSYKQLLIQLGLGLVVSSILQLVMPILAQSVVDTGIQTHNLNFIYLVLTAQLALFIGRMTIEFIRNRMLLHISTRINLSILSDFLIKLLKLPISFFDTKLTGDILQRIEDHGRIEQFLTGTSLATLFSLFNLLIFGIAALFYSPVVFAIFIGANLLYVGWIIFFLRYRKQLDFKRFALASQNQSSLIQLVQGVSEIKLNNAEQFKRWEWENLQVKQFKLSLSGLSIEQYQQAGALFINEGKNIVITFLAATAVVNGQMTLGGMLALQYIIGQLNSPVEQLIGFLQHYQDAQISLERLNEIHEQREEESYRTGAGGGVQRNTIPQEADIWLQQVGFTYPGAGNVPVLKNINLHIPSGKVTAIVGTSGSGKTTLLKLLLRFYEPTEGEITLNTPSDEGIGMQFVTNLSAVSHHAWRARCGTVLQDGFIFSDTIANNITLCDETPDLQRLLYAVQMANIYPFVQGLPLKFNTLIGADGNGISQGQRQRILMARAIYKTPDYLFLDEATNALDSTNESVILKNLESFYRNPNGHQRTVIVVAHRLSTVKNADQIVVMDKGQIAEVGTHIELTQRYGLYYQLVRNQLELGS